MSVFDDYTREKEKSLEQPVEKEGFFKKAAKTAARILLPKEVEYKLGLTKRPGEEVKPVEQPKSLYEQYQQEKGIALTPPTLGQQFEAETPKVETNYEDLKTVAKKQLTEIESRLPELKAQYEKMPKGGVVFPQGGLGGILKAALPPSATQKKMDAEKEIDNLTKAADAYREFLTHKETEPGFLNFLSDVQKGIQNQLKDGGKLIPFLGSVESFEEYIGYISATKKKNEGKKITSQEDSLIKKYQAKDLPVDRGMGYAVGSTMALLPTYAAEFAFLSPVYKGTEAVVSTSLMKAGVPKFISKAAAFILGGAAQGWSNVPEVSERTAQYMLPQADIVKGEDGDYLIAEIDKNGDSFPKAFLKSLGTVAVDYITERTGVLVEKPLGFLQRAFLGKWLAKRGLTALGNSKTLKVLKGAIAWDGIIGEVFEEELAEFFQAPIEERKYYAPFATPEGVERLLVETLAIGAFGGLGKVSDVAMRQIENFRIKEKPEPVDITPTTPTPEAPPEKVTKAETAARLFERKLAGEEQFRKTPQEAELLKQQLAKEEEKGKKERLDKNIDLLLKTILTKPEKQRTTEETKLVKMGEEMKKGIIGEEEVKPKIEVGKIEVVRKETISEISKTPITQKLINKLNTLKAREDNLDNLIEEGDYKTYVEGWCEECFPKDLDTTEYPLFAERETQKIIKENTPEGFKIFEAGYIEDEVGDNPWGASYIIYKKTGVVEEAEPVSDEQTRLNIEANAKQLGISVEEYKSKYLKAKPEVKPEVKTKLTFDEYFENWVKTLSQEQQEKWAKPAKTNVEEIARDKILAQKREEYEKEEGSITKIPGFGEIDFEKVTFKPEIEPNGIFEPETDEDYEAGFEAEGRDEVKFDNQNQVFHSTETKKETPDPETKNRVSALKQPLNQLGYALNLIRDGKTVPEELRWIVDNYNQEAVQQIGEDVIKDFGNGKYELIFSEDAQTEEGIDELYPSELYKDIKDYNKLQENYGIDVGDFSENDVITFNTEVGQRWGRVVDIYDNGRAIVETSTGEVEVDFWSLKKPSKLTKAQEKIAEGIFPEEVIKQKFELTANFMQKKGIEAPPKVVEKVKRKIPKRNITSKIFDIIKLATGKNNTLPILQNIAIKGNKIISTDLETGLTYEAEKDIGNIVLPAANLKGISIEEIKVDTKAQTAQVGATTIKAADLMSEFPILPDIKIEPQLKIIDHQIVDKFSKAAAIINSKSQKTEITAMLLKSENGKLRIASTDSFRLYQMTVPAKVIQDFEGLIPKTTIEKLVRILKQVKPEGIVEVSFDKKTKFVKFKFGKFTFVSRLVDAKFPDYKAIIPKKVVNQVVINREDLLEVLSEVPESLYNNVEVVLDEKNKKIILSKEEKEIKFKNELSVEVIASPEEIDIDSDLYAIMPVIDKGFGYNVKFLNDFLKKAKSEKIILSNILERAGVSLLQEKGITTADFVREVPEKYKAIVETAKIKPGRISADRKQYYKELGEEFIKAEAKLSEREKDELFNLLTFREGVTSYDANTLKQLKRRPELRKSNLRLQLKEVGFIPVKKLKIESANDVADIFTELKKDSREKTLVLNLDKDNQIINVGLNSIGTLDATLVHPREVLSLVLSSKAKKFYFIHNHPSGDPTPSEADLAIFSRLSKTANDVGVEMAGGIIINHTEYGLWTEEDVKNIKYQPRVRKGESVSIVELKQIINDTDLFLKDNNVVSDPKGVAEFFRKTIHPSSPIVALIGLNSRNQINGYEIIGTSLRNIKTLEKKISSAAVRLNAGGIILTTNILEGVNFDDRVVTNNIQVLYDKVALLGIDLYDVVFVGKNGFMVSKKAQGTLGRYPTQVSENISNYGEFSEEEQAVIKAITEGLPVPIELSQAVKSLQDKGIIQTGKPEKVKVEKAKKEKPPMKDMKPGERTSMRGISLSRSALSGLTHPYRISYKSGTKSVIKTFATIEDARDRFDIMVEIRAKGFFKRGELPKELQSTQAQKIEAHQVAQKNKISPSQYRRMALIYTGVDSMIKMTPEQAEKFIEMLKALTPKFGGKITIPRSKVIVTAEEAERKFRNIRVGWLLDIFRSPVNVFRRIGLGAEGKAVFEAFRLKRDFTAKWFAQFNRWQKELGIKGIFFNKKKVREQSRRLFQAINNPEAEVKLTEQESLIVSRARTAANEIADLVDDARSEVGLDPMNRKENYITNLLTEESHFLIQTTKQAPNELYALLDLKMPSSVFDRLLMERKGGLPIKQDFWQALKAMIQIHGKYIHLHPPVHRLEQFMKFYGDKVPYLSRVYVRSRINRFLGRPNVADRWMRGFDEAVTEVISKIPGLTKKTEIEFQNGLTEIIETPRLLLKPSKIFKVLKAVRYTYDLAFSISFYTINLTQFWFNTVPKLRGNVAEVYQSAFTGYAQMLMDFFRPSKWAYWKERGVLTEMDNIIDQEFNAHSMAGGELLNIFAKLSEFNNRVGSALATEKNLELLAKHGKFKLLYNELNSQFGEEAENFARNISDITQFRYGMEEKPIFFDSPITDLYYQYNTFALKQIEFTEEMAQHLETTGILKDYRQAVKEGKTKEFFVTLTQGQRGELLRFILNAFILSLFLSWSYIWEAVFKGVIPNQAEGAWKVLKGYWTGDKKLREQGFRQVLLPPSWDLIEKVADYGIVATVKNAKAVKQLDLLRSSLTGEDVELRTMEGKVKEKITPKVATGRLFKSYREETGLINSKGWDLYIDISRRYDNVREEAIKLIVRDRTEEAKTLTRDYNEKIKKDIEKLKELEVTDLRLQDNIKSLGKSKVVSKDDFQRWIQSAKEDY